MNEFWADYPTTVDAITGRFMTALETFRVLDFDVLAWIAWEEIRDSIPNSGDLAEAAQASASRAMENMADYDVTLEQYAEVAFAAMRTTAGMLP
jgi:hypothetical protein